MPHARTPRLQIDHTGNGPTPLTWDRDGKEYNMMKGKRRWLSVKEEKGENTGDDGEKEEKGMQVLVGGKKRKTIGSGS